MQEPPAPAIGTHLSEQEWIDLPEDESGELVDGALTEEEMPDWGHELTVAWLIQVLRAWFVERGGFVAGSEVKYVLARGRGRKPDVSVFFPGTPPPPRRGGVRRPPDLAVEVVSPSPRDVRRDRITKLAEYAAFGVRHYWIVDPEAQSFEAYRLGTDGRYVRLVDDLGPELVGFTLDLDQLWAELARLSTEE